MTLSRPLRWLLAGTLLATVWVAFQDEGAPPKVVPVRTGAQAAPRKPPQIPVVWPTMSAERNVSDSPWPDLSDNARAAWHVPPPPAPPAPMAPPKPKAAPPAPAIAAAPVVPSVPAFPYTLIGRYEEQGRNAALLQGPQGTLAAIANQTIDRNWRVNSVHDGGLNVTWLPTGQTKDVGY